MCLTKVIINQVKCKTDNITSTQMYLHDCMKLFLTCRIFASFLRASVCFG